MEETVTEFTSTNSPSYTTPPNEGYVFDDPAQRKVVATMVCVVSLVGLPGNSLVMLAVLLSKKLQNRTNVFVVNLAVADFLTCLLLPFQTVALLHDSWPLSDSICTAVAMVSYVGLGCSVSNLAVIAFMRHYVITKPRSTYEKLFNKTNMAFMVTASWLVPFLVVFVPHSCDIGHIGYSPRYKICTADSSHPLSDVLAMLSVVIVGGPSFVIIILCYVKIYLFVRASTQQVILRARTDSMQTNSRQTYLPSNEMEETVFRRQLKVTKNLFLVVCSFTICIIPYSIVSAVPAKTYPAIPWTAALLLFNSCVNPFIYGLKHPQFKVVFRPMLACSWIQIPEPSEFLKSNSLIHRRRGVIEAPCPE